MTDGPDAKDGTILIVCTGNVCRSPYIERRLSASLSKTNITVSSAGIAALAGSQMDPRVAHRLLQLGVSPDGFAARQLTPDIARDADLILGATREHRSSIVRMEPSVLRRTYALADFSDLTAHLVRSGMVVPSRADGASGTFVRRVCEAAVLGRAEVRARTKEEAEIVDPFRAADKVLQRMVEQVESLLPSIASVFA